MPILISCKAVAVGDIRLTELDARANRIAFSCKRGEGMGLQFKYGGQSQKNCDADTAVTDAENGIAHFCERFVKPADDLRMLASSRCIAKRLGTEGCQRDRSISRSAVRARFAAIRRSPDFSRANLS
jgi:hypothetical protein